MGSGVWAVISVQNLLNSRLGRRMSALPVGGAMAEATGIDTAQVRVAIFIYVAVLASISASSMRI
jgi:ABC-type branched-subunit amino acid transport system permease subunit